MNVDFSARFGWGLLTAVLLGGACGAILDLKSAGAFGLLLALGAIEVEERWTWLRSERGRMAQVMYRGGAFLMPAAAFTAGALLVGTSMRATSLASLWAPSLAGWALAQMGVTGVAASSLLIVGCWVIPALVPTAGH